MRDRTLRRGRLLLVRYVDEPEHVFVYVVRRVARRSVRADIGQHGDGLSCVWKRDPATGGIVGNHILDWATACGPEDGLRTVDAMLETATWAH